MLRNYTYKFEIKKDRFVYLQDRASTVRGRAIVKQIERRYTPHRIFYNHRKSGGHVAALRLHQESAFFSHFDIEYFFGQISRTRIARALRQVGFDRKRAFNAAIDSVVVENKKKIIPYGFCQSPLLATLCLEQSNLGVELRKINEEGVLVSVYVDDIILSSNDRAVLLSASERVVGAASAANLRLNTSKTSVCNDMLHAFNCIVSRGNIQIEGSRMDKFVTAYAIAVPAGKEAIEGYIEAISPDQLALFRSLCGGS